MVGTLSPVLALSLPHRCQGCHGRLSGMFTASELLAEGQVLTSSLFSALHAPGASSRLPSAVLQGVLYGLVMALE